MADGQPVSQILNFALGILIAVEAGDHRFGPLRQHGFQSDDIKAKAGIERIVQRMA